MTMIIINNYYDSLRFATFNALLPTWPGYRLIFSTPVTKPPPLFFKCPQLSFFHSLHIPEFLSGPQGFSRSVLTQPLWTVSANRFRSCSDLSTSSASRAMASSLEDERRVKTTRMACRRQAKERERKTGILPFQRSPKFLVALDEPARNLQIRKRVDEFSFT